MRTRTKVGGALTAAAVSCSVGVIGIAGTASASTIAVSPKSIVASESITALPFTNVNDVVVDGATGHVFVSGATSGTTTTAIEVLNLSGQIVGTVTGQEGAIGLALSPDGGTLYAADAGSHTVAAINASTLVQSASYSTGTAVPYAVAVTGGELWFSTSSDGYIHEVDLSSGVVSTTTADPGSDALLATSAAAPGVLVDGPEGGYGVSVYTVASGAPVSTASGDAGACENLDGIAINPDGKSLDVSCGYPYYGFEVPLNAPSTVLETYATGAYPVSVAVSGDGEVLVGTEFEPNSVYEFDPTNSTAVGGFGNPTWGDGAYKVAWGADDSVFYATVSSVSSSGNATFQTYHQFGELTLTPPVIVHPAETYTMSGQLSLVRSPIANAQVRVIRSIDGGAASTVGTFTTNASGAFAFTDHCSSASTATYTATDLSTPVLSSTVTVDCIPVAYPITLRKPRPIFAR